MVSAVMPPLAGPPASRLGQPISPALDLLLACAAPASRELPWAPDLDWDHFLFLAESHQLLPAVHARLHTNRDRVPPQTWAAVEASQQATLRKSLWLTREMLAVLDLLRARDVSAIPWKGPVLAEQAYGSVSLRAFSDLDIFIRRDEWQPAKAALHRAGYAPELRLTPRQEQAWVADSYEMAFGRGELRNLIELQWAVAPRFYSFHVSVEELFQRAQPTQLFGATITALAREDHFLMVAVHGARHLWKQLRWLSDLAHASAHTHWPTVLARSRAWRVERMLRVGMRLAVELLDVNWPEEVRSWLAEDAGAGPLAAALGRLVLFGPQPAPDSLAYFRWIARLREQPADRFRLFWRLALTPSTGEWNSLRLPDALFPAYRIVRIFRLLRHLRR
jgi:hypothetical protein